MIVIFFILFCIVFLSAFVVEVIKNIAEPIQARKEQKRMQEEAAAARQRIAERRRALAEEEAIEAAIDRAEALQRLTDERNALCYQMDLLTELEKVQRIDTSTNNARLTEQQIKKALTTEKALQQVRRKIEQIDRKIAAL